MNLIEFLKKESYPGRAIVVGKKTVYYWIMGKSENSRNRIFALTDDGIETRAFDVSKVTDPSLIMYRPVRKMGDKLVVTNGDQTDTIVQMGDFISTYQGDGNPLPSFQGEPIEVDIPTPEELWQSLNTENKVSLYTYVNGKVQLFNKHLGD